MVSSELKVQSRQILSLISIVLGRITNPVGLTLIITFISAIWLLPNYSVLGAGQGLIVGYYLMILMVIAWALYRKVDLGKLEWTAQDLFAGKYRKMQEKIHWSLYLAFLAFLFTVIIALILQKFQGAGPVAIS